MKKFLPVIVSAIVSAIVSGLATWRFHVPDECDHPPGPDVRAVSANCFTTFSIRAGSTGFIVDELGSRGGVVAFAYFPEDAATSKASIGKAHVESP